MGISTMERAESFSPAESRASPENPSTNLANPASWLTESLGASPTTSGVPVNEQTALRYAAAFACINVLSKDIAQLPIIVYEHTANDERTEDRAIDAWRVLHDRPNPMMTPFTFKQTLQAHAASWGNGYAEIEYRNDGGVQNLWPLLPDRTHVKIRDGEKWVVTRVKDPDGSERWVGLPSSRVIHIPGLGFDGITGYSVIRMARNAIGAGMAAEEFTARMFSNGASPRIALKSPNKLTPEARTNLKLSWDAAYTGLSNAHRTAVLEEGLTVEKIGLPAKDQELIDSSKFSIEQMARFFDIPLMRLHSTTAITSWGTGLEQWQRAYLTHTLGPWLVQWEEVCNWSLFTDEQRTKYFAEFRREALLQADMAARADLYTKMFGVGALSPNQIARKENMPTSGPEGDQRFVPLNFIPLSMASQLLKDQTKLDGGAATVAQDPPPAGDAARPAQRGLPTTEQTTAAVLARRQHNAVLARQRIQDAYRRVYEQVAGRVVTKQVERTRRAVTKMEGDRDIALFQRWTREFFEGERPVMQDAFYPTTNALGDMIAASVLTELGSDADFSHDIVQFSKAYVEALAAREANSSIGQLLGITNDAADATAAISAVTLRLDEWTAGRAAKVANREPVQAGNAVARHVYERSGVQRLVWVSSGGCELCQSMNGRIVSISQNFVSEGETVTGGENSLTSNTNVSHPPLHRGCSCGIAAA